MKIGRSAIGFVFAFFALCFSSVVQAQSYCASASTNTNYEWIAGVTLNGVANPSTKSFYSNFTSVTYNLALGSTTSLSLTPGYTNSSYSENWYVWIDYNRNGTFETSELVVSTYGSGVRSASFIVPATTPAGATRMRVLMSYSSGAPACGSYTYGETEDYTVNIQAGNNSALPSIITQPTNVTVTAPAAATFSVVASGTGLYYQWQKNGSNIAGANGSSYTINPTSTIDSGANFRVVITNSAGSIISSLAYLTVNPTAPVIVTQPASISVTAPASAMFSVVASGTSLSYQWQRNGVNIAGATSSSYTLSPTAGIDSGSTFRVIVTNSSGTAISNSATLTVISVAPPVITTQPTNRTVTAPAAATFSVIASGTSLYYQWQRNGANISGATSASYTLSTTSVPDSGAGFRVIVTNSGGTVTSSTAYLTVNPAPPAVVTQPTNVTVTAPDPAMFSVSASGSSLYYQWQRNGVSIAGANSSIYTVNPTSTADSGASFRVVITNSSGTVYSNSATLTVNPTGTACVPKSLDASYALGSRIVVPYLVSDIQSADLNGDGITDLVHTDPNHSVSKIVIRLGNSNLNYSLESSRVPYTLTSFALGDFNRDGKVDIVAAFPGYQNSFRIYWNPGNGVFTYANATEYPGLFDTNADSSVTGLQVADVDRNGFPDLVVAKYGSWSTNKIRVHLNPAIAHTTLDRAGSTENSIERLAPPTDVNGDGLIDLVYVPTRTYTSDPSSLMVRYSTAAGLFITAPEQVSVMQLQSPSNGVTTLTLADLNPLDASARPSVIAVQDGLLIKPNSGASTGVFSLSSWIRPEPLTPLFGTSSFASFTKAALVDVNFDCAPDLVGLKWARPQGVHVVLNNGSGSFTGIKTYDFDDSSTKSKSAVAVTAGDFDRNGTIDIAGAYVRDGGGVVDSEIVVLRGYTTPKP